MTATFEASPRLPKERVMLRNSGERIKKEKRALLQMKIMPGDIESPEYLSLDGLRRGSSDVTRTELSRTERSGEGDRGKDNKKK